MDTPVNELKTQLMNKFHELELKGLEQYAKYLVQQKKLSAKKDNWGAYEKYIDKEMVRNDKKIASVQAKIK